MPTLKPIRVVHLVATLRDGGAEAFVRGLLPRLALAPDLDIRVVSVYDPRLDAADREALGVPIVEVGRRSRSDLTFVPRLIGALRQIQPHIVHGHIHTGKYAGRIAAIAAGVPSLVFTEHGDEAGGMLRTAIKRVLNARTARFIVFTEAERERYAVAEGIAPAKIIVIPNGIPAPPSIDLAATRAELGLREGEVGIASAARLVAQKNQQLLVRAIAQLRASGIRNVRAFLIGAGDDRDALAALIAELDLRANVQLLGYRTDALRLVAACEIMALASRWEKMPLILGEAMMAGCAAVTTPWTGADAFIRDGETGFVSRDWSTEAFAEALGAAIADPDRRAAVAARGTIAARERFDLVRTVGDHTRLYRELAHSNRQ